MIQSRRLIAYGWAAFFAAGVLPLRAQNSAPYTEPDFVAPAFDLNHLSLEPAVRSQLATVLAAGVTYYNAILDEKILGIALRLDPANRAARDAAGRRKRGESPDANSGNPTFPTATIVSYLTGQSAALRARNGSDNLTLAFYLSDIAAGIDPESPAAKYEKLVCARFTPPPMWTFLKGKPWTRRNTSPCSRNRAQSAALE